MDDLASRLTAVPRGRYAHTRTYGGDQAGRVPTETHPAGTVPHLGYDDANRLASLALAGARTPSSDSESGSNGAPSLPSAASLLPASAYSVAHTYDSCGLLADRTYDAGARLLEVANTAANGDQAGVRYTLAVDDQRTEALERPRRPIPPPPWWPQLTVDTVTRSLPLRTAPENK